MYAQYVRARTEAKRQRYMTVVRNETPTFEGTARRNPDEIRSGLSCCVRQHLLRDAAKTDFGQIGKGRLSQRETCRKIPFRDLPAFWWSNLRPVFATSLHVPLHAAVIRAGLLLHT